MPHYDPEVRKAAKMTKADQDCRTLKLLKKAGSAGLMAGSAGLMAGMVGADLYPHIRSSQGCGRIGGGILARLTRAGLACWERDGFRHTITSKGLRWLAENSPSVKTNS